jgi:hypothetical protein
MRAVFLVFLLSWEALGGAVSVLDPPKIIPSPADFLDLAVRALSSDRRGYDILRVIDEECESCYMYAGTLLGSVRHHGRVPWVRAILYF